MDTTLGFAGYTIAPFLDVLSLASLACASREWSIELQRCPYTWKKAVEHLLASRYPGFDPDYLDAMPLDELRELLAFTARATKDIAAAPLEKKPTLSAGTIMKRWKLDYDTAFRAVIADCIVDDLYPFATGKLRSRLTNSYIDPMAYYGFIATVLDMLAIEYGDDETPVHPSALKPIRLYQIPTDRDPEPDALQNTMLVLAGMTDRITRLWMMVEFSVLNPIIFQMIWVQYVQLGLDAGWEFVDDMTVNTILIYLRTAGVEACPLLTRLTLALCDTTACEAEGLLG